MANKSPIKKQLGRLADTDIRLLRIFRSVVESGGFTSAEIELNISRAAISIAISDLEQRLSLRLCQRGRAGFSLTDQGEEVYEATLQLFSALEDFRTQVNSIHKQLKGELNIGITDNLVTMPRMQVTKALANLKKTGPEVKINIRMIPPSDVEKGVLSGQLHTGVVPVLKEHPGLEYIALYQEESHLYCSNNHPLFDEPQSHLSLALLEEVEAVVPAYAQSASVKAIYQKMNSSATATDREGIAFLILTGEYIGYLPTHFAEPWILKGHLKALLPHHAKYQTSIAAISKKGTKSNAVLDHYLSQLI